MKTIKSIILICFALLGTSCNLSSKGKSKTQNNVHQKSDLIRYGNDSIEKKLTINELNYMVKVCIVNIDNDTVKYKKQCFAERIISFEVVGLNNSYKLKGDFKKKDILKNSSIIDIKDFLINKVHFIDVDNSIYLVGFNVNFCKPESDYCYFYNVYVKKNGDMNIEQYEIEEESY